MTKALRFLWFNRGLTNFSNETFSLIPLICVLKHKKLQVLCIPGMWYLQKLKYFDSLGLIDIMLFNILYLNPLCQNNYYDLTVPCTSQIHLEHSKSDRDG